MGFKNVISPEQAGKKISFYGMGIEAGGRTSTIELGFNLIKDKGTLIFASHPPFGEKISLDPHDLIRGKKILGSWGGGRNPDECIPEIASLVSNSKLDTDLLASSIYKLSEVNMALEHLKNGLPGRPLLSLDSDNE